MIAFLSVCLGFGIASCFIAAVASGFAPTCWAWGVVGPPGWIVAFFLGIAHRRAHPRVSYSRRNLRPRAPHRVPRRREVAKL